jgi:hypothetical protein
MPFGCIQSAASCFVLHHPPPMRACPVRHGKRVSHRILTLRIGFYGCRRAQRRCKTRVLWAGAAAVAVGDEEGGGPNNGPVNTGKQTSSVDLNYKPRRLNKVIGAYKLIAARFHRRFVSR